MTRKIEINREEYESRVLQALRKELLEEKPLIESEAPIKIEDVRLDTSGLFHQIHILFRETPRPECLFGFWAMAVEWDQAKSSDTVMIDLQEGYWGPEEWASTIVVTLFEEQVLAVSHGIPADCDSNSITWVNGYRRLPPERARGDESDSYLSTLDQDEIDRVHEEWRRKAGRVSDSFHKKGWDVFWSLGYSVTGSDTVGRDDFSYHIIVYKPVIEAFWSGSGRVFELYDEERGVVAYVREVPTPEQAALLLEQYGIPTEKADSIRASLPDVPDEVVRSL